MFERFTDGARHVLVLAQDEAQLLGHRFIGTEHVLLGLLREGQGIASQALTDLGVSLEAARAQVEATIGAAPHDENTGSPPFTPRTKKVLELSLREALQLGDKHIATEHLLLGLVREGEGVAAQVLVALGAALPRVRAHVIELMAGRGTQPTAAAPNVWPIGRRCTFEVVRAGRAGSASAAAFAEMAELLRGLRLDLDALDPGDVHVNSVETAEGPGIRIVVDHRFD